MNKMIKKGETVIWGKREEDSEKGILLCDVDDWDKKSQSHIAWHHVGFPVMTEYGIMYAHWIAKIKD